VRGASGQPPPSLPATTGPTWWLYVLECIDGSLYTGITSDVERRYSQHCRGKAAAYTRAKPPLQLVGAMQAGSRSSALRLEYAFKQLPSREKRVRAVAMGIPTKLAHAVAASAPRMTGKREAPAT
jgi:predicted GIY-YIG superfamily endonuclease